MTRPPWLRLKQLGFADARLAALTGLSESEVAARRDGAGCGTVYKRIDTCAGEFPAATPYMYSCYEPAPFAGGKADCEADPATATRS